MTCSAYDRLGKVPNIHNVLITTTGSVLRPAGYNPSKYTKNTRSGIVTSTGHDRLLSKVPHKNWGSRRPARYLRLRPGHALPTVRTRVPVSPRVSVWPNTTAQLIAEWYVITERSLIERVTIFLYLADYEHNWILYVKHSKSTQIRPVFYIYTHERSFCLLISIIGNIRYISPLVITLWSLFDPRQP